MTGTIKIDLKTIHTLAKKCLQDNGADNVNASVLADTIRNAERDGSLSHGLFRLPAYVAALRSGKMNGKAKPQVTQKSESVVSVHGDNGSASMAHQAGLAPLIETTKRQGIGLLGITHTHHMAALWPEVEALAAHNLAGFACVSYMPMVAPAGAKEAFFGTNPVAFAWPRPGKSPFVFDMATAAMAKGEVQVAARDGHSVPLGTGLDANGEPTTDPAAIANGGVLLPFGGHKGSAIALMVELLAGGLLGESFSWEAKERDNGDGGPPQGGEFIMAFNPQKIAGDGWQDHCESFFTRLTGLDGVRLPGGRRHQNRQSEAPREINATLVEKIKTLLTDPQSIPIS